MNWHVVTIVIGLISLTLGLLGAIDGCIPYPYASWLSWLPRFHKNISPELIGIGLTVLIIDIANEKRTTDGEKRDLILQMGSPINTNSREAVRILRAREWHANGTLRGADLRDADLSEADLEDADLRGALLCRTDLVDAKLQNADLRDADLRGTDLREANFMGANLLGANLKEADLRDADLTNAKITNEQLEQADSLIRTTLPNGKKYKHNGAA